MAAEWPPDSGLRQDSAVAMTPSPSSQGCLRILSSHRGTLLGPLALQTPPTHLLRVSCVCGPQSKETCSDNSRGDGGGAAQWARLCWARAALGRILHNVASEAWGREFLGPCT